MHNDGLRNGRGRPSLRTSGRTKDRIAANQVSCKQPTTANESITTKQLTPHPRQARRQKAPPRDDKSLKIVSLCGKLLFAHLNLIFFNKRLPLIADPSVSCIFINHFNPLDPASSLSTFWVRTGSSGSIKWGFRGAAPD